MNFNQLLTTISNASICLMYPQKLYSSGKICWTHSVPLSNLAFSLVWQLRIREPGRYRNAINSVKKVKKSYWSLWTRKTKSSFWKLVSIWWRWNFSIAPYYHSWTSIKEHLKLANLLSSYYINPWRQSIITLNCRKNRSTPNTTMRV
jgi:hypothetical protein